MSFFSEDEIEKAKTLRDKKIYERARMAPRRHSVFFNRNLPSGVIALSETCFIISDDSLFDDIAAKSLWLPSFDEALEGLRHLDISFAQITDYIHRKRYADGRERLGLYQLLIETLR